MKKHGKALGWKGYGAIVKAAMDGPIHALDVMERFGICRQTARRVLTRLHELRVFYIADWAFPGKTRTGIPVYRYGDEPDAPGVTGKPGGWVRKPLALHNRLVELTHFVGMLRLLEGPIRVADLSEAVGSNYNNVLSFIRAARKIKLIRVADWEYSRYGPVALYALGSKPDAQRPKPMTQQEINRRYYAARHQKAQMVQIIRALSANSEREAA